MAARLLCPLPRPCHGLTALGGWRGLAVAKRKEQGPTPQELYQELKLQFGHVGVVNHKEIGVWNLFEILRGVRNKFDLGIALQTMNLFYNFGVKLKHRELSTRFLAATMRAKQESEALELVKLYGAWLQHPPDAAVVYAVMSKFVDDRNSTAVRDLAKMLREDWRWRLGAPLYSLAIQAMLFEEDGLPAALLLHQDAVKMGVRLEPKVHLQLLDACLLAYERSSGSRSSSSAESSSSDAAGATALGDEKSEALPHLLHAVAIADALRGDGHGAAGSSAAVLCSLAWLRYHVVQLPEEARTQLQSHFDAWSSASLDLQWSTLLEAACGSFGSQAGFSSQLPAGLFRRLEALSAVGNGVSADEARRLVRLSRQSFGRFYPAPAVQAAEVDV
ncbi:unnamed protein product [Durusdinium trenchii]|uniref:Uncharacterized protein n=1 Tax=Durusdinium trenchii TaxID=1381693 RepID=A0ABP0NM62_9DINO